MYLPYIYFKQYLPISYTLPEDPKEARKDFDVIDNRKGKAGLEYEFDGIAARKGEGNYYVENNKTGSLVTATTRKEAEFLAYLLQFPSIF